MVENIKTYKILLSGRVQGVGFRYFAESVADKYSVKGYVKNTVNLISGPAGSGKAYLECNSSIMVSGCMTRLGYLLPSKKAVIM